MLTILTLYTLTTLITGSGTSIDRFCIKIFPFKKKKKKKKGEYQAKKSHPERDKR
jgi:hypothetical protein